MGDVDDAMTATVGSEHGEVGAVVVGELEVDTGPLRVERTDQLVDQAVPFQPPDTGHDGDVGAEIKGERPVSGLDRHTVDAHMGQSAGLLKSLSHSASWGSPDKTAVP